MTQRLIERLFPVAGGDDTLARTMSGLVDRSGDRDVVLTALDRAFGFYDAALGRAIDEETMSLAQHLTQASLERIALMRQGDPPGA